MPTKQLDPEERMRLMKFVCSFAWADLEVKDSEREFIKRLMKRLDLSSAEKKQVEQWLELPPAADELDPNEVPRAHRQLFVDTARAMIAADGVIDEQERENLRLLEMLLK
jgi:uncharacterized tellurite resistance protein B-like protein